MDLYDVMRTTFAARDFTDDEIPDETLYRILDNARFAPSGGNRQGGRVIVVKRRRYKDCARAAMFASITGLWRTTSQRGKPMAKH